MAISLKEGLRGLLGLEERLSILETNNLRGKADADLLREYQDAANAVAIKQEQARYYEMLQIEQIKHQQRMYEAQQREMTMQNNLLMAYYHAMALREELLDDLLRRRNG